MTDTERNHHTIVAAVDALGQPQGFVAAGDALGKPPNLGKA
jgi:hypothetical protein